MKAAGIFGANYELVLRILESDPSQARYVSRDDCTPLSMLCRYPDVPDHVVLALIEANPKALTLKGSMFKSTPLGVGCEHGVTPSVIEIMVKANPDTLELKDGRGLTPLEIAHRHGHAQIVRLLKQMAQI